MYVCMYACMYACMYVWMDGCMYVCMHVCMDGCMYVCVCVLNVMLYDYMRTYLEEFGDRRKQLKDLLCS